MKTHYWWYVFFGLVITLIGIITKKFLFLMLLLPFSLFLKNEKHEN
jgi:hypothetical protein|tara:strand:+ start:2347 stop:2484 length:138 start_codon:yes stop_codon:yes gene_type:complete